MALTSGSRFGAYEIAGPIGAGGMGEVYRATDTKLGRAVALKVLPDAVAEDAGRLARLDREARTLAALNHPNIASLFGVEAVDGSKALVMELVEGRTLADRIVQGALPVDDALDIGRQLADALEAAHEQGVIHRDLKPANVIVRPDGLVKVLDFGLAKVVDQAEAADRSTVTALDATRAGSVLGTPAYMSPEQARGETLDRRTDIWSFGCVLFEMLTGRQAFGGETTSEALAAILTGEVAWSSLPQTLPPSVSRLLRRCLDRDTRRRLRDIGEARLMLEDPSDDWAPPSEGTPAHESRPWVPVAAALAVGAVLGGLGGWLVFRTPVVPSRLAQTSVLVSDGVSFAAPGRRFLAISPDGSRLAYTADPGLLIRDLGDRNAWVLDSVQQDSRSPFFSPSGAWLGYYAAGALWKVALTGGAPERIVDAINPWSASWHDDGTILYGQGPDGIWRVSEDGGAAEQLVTVDPGESAHGPQMLPGGEWVLFTLLPAGVSAWDRAEIVAESLETGERVTLVNGGRDGRYLAAGYLVYGVDGDLRAVPFDVGSLRVVEPSVTVIEGVADGGGATGAVQFDVAEDGSLIYAPAAAASDELQLAWVEPNGLETVLPGAPRTYRHPRVSPTGTQIVASIEDARATNIWIGESDQGLVTPLTTEGGDKSHPEWSPDGTRIAFFSARSGGGLFTLASTGLGSVSQVVEDPAARPASWTPDGRLLYEEFQGGQVSLVDTLADPGATKSFTIVNVPYYFDLLHAALSPDGRWLAYHSMESGRFRIHVRPFPDGASSPTLSIDTGTSPVWSRDGNSIYFLGGEGIAQRARPPHQPGGYLMKVDVTRTNGGLSLDEPEALFSLDGYVFPDISERQYDVAPDGRFLMLKDATAAGRTPVQIVLVQNWLGELTRRGPRN